ncbi:hypothetical protein BDZ89DRAFT_1128336 [Hymenopellis radicata]|nr:hypothetical protein BDZ89DRAFT_1128336 [Hymenopellis radicata]
MDVLHALYHGQNGGSDLMSSPTRRSTPLVAKVALLTGTVHLLSNKFRTHYYHYRQHDRIDAFRIDLGKTGAYMAGSNMAQDFLARGTYKGMTAANAALPGYRDNDDVNGFGASYQYKRPTALPILASESWQFRHRLLVSAQSVYPMGKKAASLYGFPTVLMRAFS